MFYNKHIIKKAVVKITDTQKNEIGKIYGDFKIIKFVYRNNNNNYYLVECLKCGCKKIVGINNIKNQQKTNTLLHSKLNCDIKYYIYEYLNKEFGDYKVVGFIKHHHRGWLFQLRCKICGHYYVTDFKSLADNMFNHSYKNCEEDYLKNYKNKIIGDFKCFFAKRDKHLAFYLYGKCLVCNTYIKIGEKYFKENFQHNYNNICIKSSIGDFKEEILNRFHNIKERCNNKNNTHYHQYGGRDIKCEFEDSVSFYNFVKDDFKIKAKKYGAENIEFDRINNNGNYSKDNLRIVTKSINAYNKGCAKFFKITNGEKVILSNSAKAVAEKYGGNERALGNMVRKKSNSWKSDKFKWRLTYVENMENGKLFEKRIEELSFDVDEKIIVWEE